MANIFTYLGTLEELKSKIQWEDKSSTEIEERLRLVGMLYYVADTINYFERAVKKAEESIIIRDLADVDFDYWTNINNWEVPDWLTDDDLREAHLWHYWNIHNNRAYISSKLSNDITGLLPAPPKLVEYNDADARSGLSECLQLLQGVYFNSNQLRCAIYQGILALIETLKNLHSALNRPRTDEEYAAWYDELRMEFSSLLIQNLSRNYAYAVNLRLNGLGRDWLMERFGEAALAFWDTQYMHERKKACTNEECKNQPIYFEIPNLSKDQQRKFFHILLEVGTFSENGYVVDKPAQAGRCIYLLYLNNIKEQAIIDFFTFQITAQLISADLPDYPAEKQSKKKKKRVEQDDDLQYMTFKLRGITIGHINLLHQKLCALGWIPKDTPANDFCDLFSGKAKYIRIQWNIGKGTLRYLFSVMYKQKKISIDKGYTVTSILEHHFVDENGQLLTGLHSGKEGIKVLPLVNQCFKILLIEPPDLEPDSD